MGKREWIIIIVLILAVVGYYFIFVSESSMLGPRLLQTGVVTPGTGGGESAIPTMGINPYPGKFEKIPECCTTEAKLACKTCQKVCPACAMVGYQGEECDNCAESDKSWMCLPNPRLFGEDEVPCEFSLDPFTPCDDQACCNGTIYDPLEDGCCCGSKVYSLSTECCGNGCEKIKIICVAPGVEQAGHAFDCNSANGDLSCSILVMPDYVTGAGLACGGTFTYSQVESYLNGPPTSPQACHIKHEMVHQRQYKSCSPPERTCDIEIEAYAVQSACYQQYLDTHECPEYYTPADCDFAIEQKKNSDWNGRFVTCLCDPQATCQGCADAANVLWQLPANEIEEAKSLYCRG